jgi:hypothetical protein
MTSFNQFNALAASRGEGLHPKLRDLLERSAPPPHSETSVRYDGMLQAGPSPPSELAVLNGTVTLFPSDKPLAPAANELKIQKTRKSTP